MKNFCKWLGVNEKVAKIVVWIFIVVIFLIVINTALESVGLPFYKLTIQNLSKINLHYFIDSMISWITVILNFYASTLLVFSIKKTKEMFPYACLFLIISIITTAIGYATSQIAIFVFLILFAYQYSGKNRKYIIYMIVSLLINTSIQYLSYFYKIRFINYAEITRLNQFLLSLDYFVVIILIILLKEVFIKKKIKK